MFSNLRIEWWGILPHAAIFSWTGTFSCFLASPFKYPNTENCSPLPYSLSRIPWVSISFHLGIASADPVFSRAAWDGRPVRWIFFRRFLVSTPPTVFLKRRVFALLPCTGDIKKNFVRRVVVSSSPHSYLAPELPPTIISFLLCFFLLSLPTPFPFSFFF